MRALIIDGEIAEYPSDFYKFKNRDKRIIYPTPVTNEDYENLGLFRVAEEDPPEHDSATENTELESKPVVIDGRPVIKRKIVKLNAAERADKAQNQWENDMELINREGVTDIIEEIISSMPPSQFAKLSESLQDKHTRKKAKREQKP